MPHLQNSITKWWFEQLSLLGYIFACQCVVVEGWMSSRQVKAAAYKAAESRASASRRGSRDASKKSANLACSPAEPPLTNLQNTPADNTTNQPSHLFIVKKSNVINLLYFYWLPPMPSTQVKREIGGEHECQAG